MKTFLIILFLIISFVGVSQNVYYITIENKHDNSVINRIFNTEENVEIVYNMIFNQIIDISNEINDKHTYFIHENSDVVFKVELKRINKNGKLRKIKKNKLKKLCE